MNSDFLPFALPSIGEDEIAEVVDSLRSGWLTTGPKTKRFESEFAEFIGVNNALAVNSATAGLHLALEALGIGKGDKVAVPTYTFTATAEVVRYLGADPVFIDSEPDTFNMDPVKLSQAIEQESAIKAVVPVHFAGHPCDMDRIHEVARAGGLRIVEDAAHTLPTEYKGRMIGTLSDITVYSFYVTKTIATGEGGMVVCLDERLVPRMKTMRLHGISRDVFERYTSEKPSWHYEVIAPGFKYNMTDIAASLGIHQLRKAELFRSRREEIAQFYLHELGELPVKLPVTKDYCNKHSWHLFVLRVQPAALVQRDELIIKLAEKGVGSSVHFIPLHMQPYWRDTYNLKEEDFPAATRDYQQAISLPIYPKMTDEDVLRVANSVRNILS